MYISDPDGRLLIDVKKRDGMGNYRQGSKTADLMFCRDCGVLVAVTCESQGVVFGAVNARCLDAQGSLGKPVIVSPQTLPKEEKTARWHALWTSNVQIKVSDS